MTDWTKSALEIQVDQLQARLTRLETGSNTKQFTKFDKTAYMREYMRDKRKMEADATLTEAYELSKQFWADLAPLYPGVDLESEQRKMLAWLMTPRGRGRSLTRRFIVSWLNRLDTTLAATVKPDSGNNGHRQRWQIEKELPGARLAVSQAGNVIEHWAKAHRGAVTHDEIGKLFRQAPAVLLADYDRAKSKLEQLQKELREA